SSADFWSDFHLRLFFNFDTDEVRLKWNLKLQRTLDGAVHIHATARTVDLQNSFKELRLELDTNNWHPVAMIEVLQDGNEIIYQIENWRTNAEDSAGWDWKPDFVDFKSRGYKSFWSKAQ